MSQDKEEELAKIRQHRSRRNPAMQTQPGDSDLDQPYTETEDSEETQPGTIKGRMTEEAESSGANGEGRSSFTTLGSIPLEQKGSRLRVKTASAESAASKTDRKLPLERSAGQQRQQNKKKKRRRIIAMIIAECFALLLIFGYAYVAKRLNMVQREEFNISKTKNNDLTVDDIKKMKGYWMIAVFGVDSRNSNVGKGTNADVNMICCINRDTGDIKLVSVFRDSYLNIDEKGNYNKLNAAYAHGGPEQAVAALNKNLDLNITDYITFNWKAVAESINLLGGVDVELSKAEFRYINSFITETVKSTGIGSHQLKKAGMNHLDGVQAVAYGRLRLMDSDYARTERQRKIIELAFQKAQKADYAVLNNILVTVLPQVSTSLGFADLTNVALNITKYKIGETGGFPFSRGDANMGKRGACVIPTTLESNVIQLHQFLFGDEIYAPTDAVRKISAKIASDTGLYKEGSPVGHVTTEGTVPKATKAPETKQEETKKKEEESETDRDGNVIPKPDASESSTAHPGIGETDPSGNLIDPPEDLSIPGENPTESKPGKPGTPGTKPEMRPETKPETKPSPSPGIPETEPLPGPGTTRPPETSAAIQPGDPVETSPTSPTKPTPPTKPTETAPVTTIPGPGSTPGGNPTPGGDQMPGEVIGSQGPGQ
ncbi:MAG: LCP family protein [Hungatella sp.]